MKINNENLNLVVIIFIGLFIRLFLIIIPGFKIDIDTWFAWAIRLSQLGLANFYSDQVWTNYTTGYLYILYVLGVIKNYFYLNNETFYLILKIPAILAELLLGLVTYKFIYKKSSTWAIIITLFVVLNPAFIFNSAVWGQIDGILTILLILSVLALVYKHLIISSVFFAICLLTKPQGLFLIPVFIFYFISNPEVKNLAKFITIFIITIILGSLPFFLNNPLFGPINLFINMFEDYPYTSAFAYNLWGIIGFWLPDNQVLLNFFSIRDIGYFFVLSYWLIIVYFNSKNRLSYITIATLAALSFYFLPTRAHERYLYPGLVFIILSAGLLRSRLLLSLAFALSIIHFLNLYYVYIYYNELQPNSVRILYNQVIYQLLNTYSRLLSIISLVIFLLITFFIIKFNAKFRKV